jgi:hypothetical protein
MTLKGQRINKVSYYFLAEEEQTTNIISWLPKKALSELKKYPKTVGNIAPSCQYLTNVYYSRNPFFFLDRMEW